MKAVWNNQVIAESSDTVVVESNHYFPPESVNMKFLRPSTQGSVYECPWKGHADYFDVTVGDKTNEDSAWIYKQPTDAVSEIAGHIAFWKGIEVTE